MVPRFEPGRFNPQSHAFFMYLSNQFEVHHVFIVNIKQSYPQIAKQIQNILTRFMDSHKLTLQPFLRDYNISMNYRVLSPSRSCIILSQIHAPCFIIVIII